MKYLSFMKTSCGIAACVLMIIAHTAHAQIPIITNLVNGTDPDVLAGGTGFAAASTAWQAQINSIVANTTELNVIATEDKSQKQAEDFAELAAYKAAQIISKKLIGMALNELNGGASGFDHPELFVKDFAQLANDLVTKETTIYTNSLLQSGQENPFATTAAVALINSASATGLGVLNSNINKIPGVDYNYASRDISTAGIKGWDFYSQLSKPQNTPIGTMQIARDSLARSISAAEKIEAKELSTSGYKPSKSPCDVTYQPPGFDLSATGWDEQTKQQFLSGVEGKTNAGKQAYISGLTNLSEGQKNTLLNQLNTNQSANSEYGLKCANQVITNPKGAIETIGSQALVAPFQKYEKESKWYTLLFDSIEQLAKGLITTGLNKIPTNPILDPNDQGTSF